MSWITSKVRAFLARDCGKVQVEYMVAVGLIVLAIAYGVKYLAAAANNQNNATSNMLNGGSYPGGS